jgi:putative tricarboxylic transport membrane protein
MAEGTDNEDPMGGVVSNRTMNMAVALALMIIAATVMVSSYRLGSGWAKDVGPDSGYFPFYVSLFLFIASGVTLVQHLLARSSEGSFIAHGEMVMVFSILIPMTLFVILSLYIGIYISTFLFITFFMMWHGRYSLYKTFPVALLVPIALFIVFEIWFLVPLPKGPVEAWLGY